MSFFGRVVGLAGLACGLVLLYFSTRWGWADWLSKRRTKESIQAAVMLAPDNWNFYQNWSEIAPGDAIWALKQALGKNPVDSELWLDLAGKEEKAGSYSEAEADMRRGVELDRTSGPRMMMAEFYFRRKQADNFWSTARAALEMTANPDDELFRDAWTLSADGNFIRRRMVPDRPEVLLRYLQFLVSENKLEAAHDVAGSFMEMKRCCVAPEMVRGVLGDYVERLAAANDVTGAVKAWNWLANEKLIPYSTVGDISKSWVLDGDFTVMPGEGASGFNWRMVSSEGAFADYLAKERAINFTFTGKEAEQCEMLSENVVLQPGRRYQLSVKYATRGIEKENGIHWQVLTPTGENLLAGGGLQGGVEAIEPVERAQKFEFAGPAMPTVARLVLRYDRLVGTVRVEGGIEIRKVDGTVE